MITIRILTALIILACVFVLGAIAGQWDTFRVVRRRMGRPGDKDGAAS